MNIMLRISPGSVLGTVLVFLSAATMAWGQIPQRELDVPPGTSLTGLAHTDIAFSRQSIYVLDPAGPAKLAWATLLGTNVSDVASDGQTSGMRYFIQNDGSFYDFRVFPPQFSAPHLIGTLTPLKSTELFRKIFPAAMEIASSTTPYRSFDGGQNWRADTMGLGTLTVADMAADSSVGLLAVVTGTGGGLFRRLVADSAWSINPAMTVTGLTKVFVDRRRRIFVAAGSAGVYGSTDNGATWTRDSAGMGARVVTIFNDDAYGNVYAVTDTGRRVYRTTNAGASWTRIDASIIPVYLDPISSTTFSNVGGDSTVFCSTVYGLFASTDRGMTWTEHNDGMPAENVGAIVRVPGGRELVSSDLGVYKRESGNPAWTRVWPTAGYFAVGAIQRDSFNYYFTAQRSTSTQTSPRVVYKSTDRGSTWAADTLGLWVAKRNGTFFVDELGTQHLAQSGTSTAKVAIFAKPAGGSWAIDTAGFVSTGSTDIVGSMASNQKGLVFLCGQFTGGNMWSRPVTGGAWQRDTVGLDTVRIVALVRDANNNMLAGGRAGTISRRVGGRWATIPPTPGIDPTSVAYQLSTDSTGALVVGYRIPGTGAVITFTYPGVYVTKDTGLTWHFLGLQNYGITNMQSYGDTTYAMITGRGAFRLTSHFTPALRIASSEISFGTVNVGEHVNVPVSLTNSGTDTLRITGISSDLPSYVPQWTSKAIAPGVTVYDTIQFSPTAVGVASGYLTIASNAPTSPDRVSLIGVGKASSLALSARIVNFGNVRVLRTGKQVVSVVNHGSDTLRITSVSASPAMFTSQPASLTIPPGGTQTDTLFFNPTSAGAASGVVVLTSNSPSSPDTVRVSGVGAAPQLFVNSRVIRCGTTIVNQPAEATVRITNRGTDTLHVTSVTSTNPVFVVTSLTASHGIDLAPGDAVEDTVVFTPVVIDTNRGELVIISDASSSPDTLSLIGVGMPDLGVDENLVPVFAVGEPFPNPSRGETAIPYTMARAGRVRVEIVDALGRTVAMITDDQVEAGAHAVVIGKSQLPAVQGSYFVVFTSAGSTCTRRLTVVE